jgi:AraC family ethanolamine operon transcriptional activator
VQETHVVAALFDDFETFHEAMAGWDLDWCQLDAGPLQASLTQLACGPAMLTHLTFNRSFLQRGNSPPGITFGLPDAGPEFDWCGKPVRETHLVRFSPESEYESVSHQGFAAHTLSYAEPYLHELAHTLGLEHVSHQLVGGLGDWRIDGRVLEAVRSRLQSVCAEVGGGPPALTSLGLANELTFDIPAAMLKAIASGAPTRAPSARLRTQGFRRAMAFIESHTGDPLTVGRVCRASGVSWRTLNYAFPEKLGVTLERYLKVNRLHGLRRELRGAGVAATISTIANSWGFWHMGKLAGDYRAQFGELPSDTRQRPSLPSSAATV